MSPTEAERARNRAKQAELRARRRADQVRMSVWTSRTLAEDFRAVADARGLTHAELLAQMIRRFRDEVPGQSVIDG